MKYSTMKLLACTLCLFFAVASKTFGQQQIPDLNFEFVIENPKYGELMTSLIGVDAGHNNLHTIEGGFGPFAKLLKNDGYELSSVLDVSQESLEQLNIFIIVNPLAESNIGNWAQPVASALSKVEISIIKDWVFNGGSLLVIADHMPFAGAANNLANEFGFEYLDGFVLADKQSWPPEIYSKKEGTLFETVITYDIDSIAGFTGSALKAPSDSEIIAVFPSSHNLLMPEVAWEFDDATPKLEVNDLAMGAIMDYGKGKVAFFTEAAMFTAQILQERYSVGFNSPKANQNAQFVLKLIHWLDSGKTYTRAGKTTNEYSIVDNLLSEQAKAFVENRMESVASFYSNDAIIYEPNGTEIRGMNSILNYWNQLSEMGVSWDYKILETEKIGEQILTICKFEIGFKRNDNMVLAKSKALLTLKLQDGQYRIFRDFYMPLR